MCEQHRTGAGHWCWKKDDTKTCESSAAKEKPICSANSGYFYARTAQDIIRTIEMLQRMIDGLQADIQGLKACLAECYVTDGGSDG